MKEDRFYLLHVRDAVDRVLAYTTGGREAFFSDPRTQDAVVRNLEVIGEAVKRVSDTTRSANPDVPWKRIAGLRDKLIHEYFGVNLNLVWEVVAQQLVPLRVTIERLLARDGTSGGV